MGFTYKNLLLEDGDDPQSPNSIQSKNAVVLGDYMESNDVAVSANTTAIAALGTEISEEAEGTAYQLTDTAAAIDLGTTDPAIVVDAAGTYLILAQAVVEYNGATFAANQDLTIKLRRTNNTAADICLMVVPMDIVTTITGIAAIIDLPPILYTTTNTDDALALFGDIATVPSAGSLDVTAAKILAVRIK